VTLYGLAYVIGIHHLIHGKINLNIFWTIIPLIKDKNLKKPWTWLPSTRVRSGYLHAVS
jgi:hypothetical protein